MPSYPTALHQPPTGRPRWINESEADHSLQYLAWGSRAYGRQPIPISQHAGWTYQIIVEGQATLALPEKRVAIPPGTLVLIGPGCACGWAARRADDRCKIIAWIWREAPLLETIRPPEDAWRSLRLSPPTLKELDRLHHESRHETSQSDLATGHAIQSIKSRLDVILSRLGSSRAVPSTAEAKLKIALAWLKKHPEILSPVSPLCDTLKISPSSLNRLFRENLNQSVRDVAYANRMALARTLLRRKDLSIKEVSLCLGYSQANDFTRAFSHFWGKPPSETHQIVARK